MGLELFKAELEAIRERILAYSYSGFGKSRLITSLPNTPKWGQGPDSILYYPADNNAEFLGSTLPHYRDRIAVLRPKGDDPIANFTAFATTNWRERFPNARTMIVDAYSTLMFRIMLYCANNGMMSQETHYVIGVPGTTGSQAIPNRSDYFAVQNLSRNLLDLMFENQKDMNIIFAFHEDITMAEGVGSISGPSHPGKTMALEIPGRFDTVVRLVREPTITPEGEVKMQVFAVTASNGQFVAKIRESGATGNPIPKVLLDNDPVNFWKLYDAVNQPQTQETT